LATADIIVVPGWHDLTEPPGPDLITALQQAQTRGALLVGLCYGDYALAYAGLLDNRQAATHWLAEPDFTTRFPRVTLDTNALYVEDGNLVTSAGTTAGLDCCLFIVRQYYGVQMANRVARIMVVPPHREGGQAQYIEQPVARSTQDARINQLLDYLRANLAINHSIDDLAQRTAMTRRTFTRNFQKATGVFVGQWLINERIQRGREFLETTSVSVERIAEMLGFQTATTFRQHFREFNQVSPTAWRRTFAGV
jgi:transcriptional regulator GlxA family with amidase domain